jgi:hypothetical protein
MAFWRPVFFWIVIAAVVLAPFDVAFFWWDEPPQYSTITVIIDVICILDMLMHFNIALIVKGQVVRDRREIACHYIRSWFFVDCLSNVPLDWFIGAQAKSRKLVKLFKLPRLLRFVKLLRVLKDSNHYLSVISIIAGIVLCAHYCTCFWTWAFVDVDETTCGTISTCPPVDEIYVEGFSISMSIIWGSDAWMRLLNTYGVSRLASQRVPGQPLKPFEEVATAVMTMFGLVLVACLFASVSYAVVRSGEIGRLRSTKVALRKAEMKAQNIPKQLQSRVEATYENLWLYGHERHGMLNDHLLNLDLRRNLALCCYGNTLRAVPIFSELSDDILKKVAQHVTLNLYTPGDYIVNAGELCTELFVILCGIAQPIDIHGKVVNDAVLREGDFFGESCFRKHPQRRTGSVRSVDLCRALELNRNVFHELNLDEELLNICEEEIEFGTHQLII